MRSRQAECSEFGTASVAVSTRAQPSVLRSHRLATTVARLLDEATPDLVCIPCAGTGDLARFGARRRNASELIGIRSRTSFEQRKMDRSRCTGHNVVREGVVRGTRQSIIGPTSRLACARFSVWCFSAVTRSRDSANGYLAEVLNARSSMMLERHRDRSDRGGTQRPHAAARPYAIDSRQTGAAQPWRALQPPQAAVASLSKYLARYSSNVIESEASSSCCFSWDSFASAANSASRCSFGG